MSFFADGVRRSELRGYRANYELSLIELRGYRADKSTELRGTELSGYRAREFRAREFRA